MGKASCHNEMDNHTNNAPKADVFGYDPHVTTSDSTRNVTINSMYKGGKLEGLGGPVGVDEYTFDGIDPALEDCCRREVESNRRSNALTSTLRRHDIAAHAERRRRNLVKTLEFEGCRCCYDPNSDGGEYLALMEYKAQQEEGERGGENEQSTERHDEEGLKQLSTNDHDDSDDEFDYLLDEDFAAEDDTIRELEERRRVELEYEILMRQVAAQHGYGVHRQVHPARVLKAAGLGTTTAGGVISSSTNRIPPPAVVLHLVDPESTASASLDYFLEKTLAPANPGTVFLRSGGRSTLLMDPSLAQKHFPSSILDPDRDMPALVAIRDGVVVNVCPRLQGLTMGGGRSNPANGVVETHALVQWLDNSGVLLSEAPRMDVLCAIRPEEEALMDYLSTKEPQPPSEERYDCGIDGCNKSFRHEHVGIQTSEQDGLVVKEETIVGDGQ